MADADAQNMLLLVLAVPFLVGQALSPRRAILRPTAPAIVLVIAAVILQIVAALEPSAARLLVPSAFAIGTVAVASVVWTSCERATPTAFAALGGLMNVVPIAVYGAMPVITRSREAISSGAIDEPELLGAKHVELDLALSWSEPATLLADWLPVPFLSAVVSPGDILLAAAFLALGVHARRVAKEESQPAPNVPNMAVEGSTSINSA
ncbi:MAG: DUF5317 family protein [Acidimicrobiales bacterium]